MVASLFALVLSVASTGMFEGGTVLRGRIVDSDGQPASGALVVAAGEGEDPDTPAELGRATADADGRFTIRMTEGSTDCDQPTLFAIRSGFSAASCPIDLGSGSPREHRLVLGRPTSTSIVVYGPDGRPVQGARVVPRRVAREFEAIPEAIGALASTETNGEGRASIQAFRAEELLGIRIQAAGFGVQDREFAATEGMAGFESKAVTLIATGKVTGRVVAEDPRAVAGLTVRLSSSNPGQGRSSAGLAETLTDASGHFEVEAIAGGTVLVRVRPRPGQAGFPARIARRRLGPGQVVNVELPLRPGVKVFGLVLDDRDERPIAGAVVSIIPPGPAEPVLVRTDASGRYEAFVPSGLVGHRVLKVPPPYLCPPAFVGPRPVEVPPAIARFELPKVALTRGLMVRGTVRDESRRPVEGARVEASWTLFEGRIRAPRSARGTSGADGSFVVGPVAADAEVTLGASRGESTTGRDVAIRASQTPAVELTVVEAATSPLGGRVVDRDGRAVAGASVRIWAVDRTPAGSVVGRSPIRFAGLDTLTTDADGCYRSPGRLRIGQDYLALASRDGYLEGQTRAFRLAQPGPSLVPDLILPVLPERVAIEGRVVTREGRPIARVTVRVPGDESSRRSTTTDLDGRFRLDGVRERNLLVFAEAEGFRFLGRAIDPRRGPVELTLTRLDQVPELAMISPLETPGDPARAWTILAPYVDRVLSEGDHVSRVKTLERLARIDPKRALALVHSRAAEDGWLGDHLRQIALQSLAGRDADGRKAIVEAIRDAEFRVVAALDAAKTLPATSRAQKLEYVERAWREARSIEDSGRRLGALARVADHLLDLGEVAEATKLLEEARPIAESLGSPGSGPAAQARAAFAESLARVDPAQALACTKEILDPGAFDRCHLRIARRMAAREPSGVAGVIDSLRDPGSLAGALPALCHALAPVDPALAHRLMARTKGGNPCLPAYALGMMALAVADRDKPVATDWLREAFDRLAKLERPAPGSSHEPAAVAAALLPVAERIDPKLVPEFFWKAISLHVPRPGSEGRSEALLALLIARYDLELARTLLKPAVDRALESGEVDLATILSASAILDPERAMRLVDQLPEPPDLTFHHPKNEARLALAAALARGALGCWEHAAHQTLELWTASAPDGD